MAKSLSTFLVDNGYITSSQLTTAESKVNAENCLDDVLIEIGAIEDIALAKAKSKFYNVPFVDLIETAVDSEVAMIVPEKFARKNTLIPYNQEGGALAMAMYHPRNYDAIKDVEFSSGLRVIDQVTTKAAILKCIDAAYKVSDNIGSVMKNIDLEVDVEFADPDAAKGEDDLTDEEKMTQEAPIIKMVNMIFVDAVRKGASDIHLEPMEKLMLVRCRFDGWLRNTMQAPKWMQWPVTSRIKIMAKIDISEKRRPQDGKIRIKVDKRDIDLRVSTLPTRHGEKVVIRILDQTKSLVPLEQLGMDEETRKNIFAAIQKPQGMILVTGPTGSGKTTSLYSFLSTVTDETLNIVTIEDPIEYELKGINQVQINEKAGLTFASALRSILRQDPNIVMVGEIRDGETAEIAVKAAQTGHLVFSTLHTNDTVSTITRLIHIGIEPFLISSSVIIILAQRLVRKICPDCKEEYQPEDWILHQLQMQNMKDMKFYRGAGCPTCNHVGYKGRTGIYEVLRMTPELRQAISARKSEEMIKATALQEGMLLLIQDTINKIRDGITSPDEVVKVIHVDEMASSAFCPKCEKPIRSEFKGCPYCGQKLSLECRSCKRILEVDWNMCPYCGTDVEESEKQDLPQRGLERAARPEPPPEMKAKGLSKPKVLIADDEPKILLMVKASLKQINCEVLTANNGEEGLAMVEKHLPNLVISDINMPKMNGFEFCKAMRRNLMTAFIPFIMLTSRDTGEDKLKGFQLGTDDYMTKPFDYKELQARVQRLLERTYG